MKSSADTASVVDLFLDAVRTASIPRCAVWSDDAVLDATVPGWRFRAHGPAAIRTEYETWFADPGEFLELERTPLPDGEVVRYLLTWQEDGIEHRAHHLHVLSVANGHVRRDTVMCGGRWPAHLVGEMAAAQARSDASVGA